VAFVEVKMRRNANFGHPVEFVNEAKVERVFRAAEQWARANNAEHLVLRFDVIGILTQNNGSSEITHYEDAYR
jgi:putative endonuclease